MDVEVVSGRFINSQSTLNNC